MIGDPLNVYVRALDTWGIGVQEDIFIEEAAEAIQAISHFRRDRCDMDTVCGELADLQVMLDQMKIVYGVDRFNAIFAKKIIALDAKLENHPKRL